MLALAHSKCYKIVSRDPILCQLNPAHSLKVRPVFLSGVYSHQTGGRKYRIIFHKQSLDSRPLLAAAACMSVWLYHPIYTESSSFQTKCPGHLRKVVSIAGRCKRISSFLKHPDRRSHPRSVVPRQCSRRCPRRSVGWSMKLTAHA